MKRLNLYTGVENYFDTIFPNFKIIYSKKTVLAQQDMPSIEL